MKPSMGAFNYVNIFGSNLGAANGGRSSNGNLNPEKGMADADGEHFGKGCCCTIEGELRHRYEGSKEEFFCYPFQGNLERAITQEREVVRGVQSVVIWRRHP